MFARYQFLALAFLVVSACSSASPPPERPALTALLNEKKFEPHGFYTGADTPEDQMPLQAAVDKAIEDIRALPEPLSKAAVRMRLEKLIAETDLYATEDRDEVGRYSIRIWRAAGFTEESGLFAVSDEQVLSDR